MIELCNIKKTFDNNPLLEDISFTVPTGERISLTGPGGCGKSTLLKILLGLERPDSGQVRLLQTPIDTDRSSAQSQILRRVGMAFQQGALFDFMTVEENLRFAMERMTDFQPEKVSQRVDDLLAAVKLSRAKKQFPYELSGGMKRRVGIARALSTDPDIAIFDEPTAGLDPVTSTIILNMIKDLGAHNPNATMLVSTSNVEIALRFAPRIVVVNDGKVCADGPWRDLILEGSEWVRHFLSVRLIGLDREYVDQLGLPEAFLEKHWGKKSQ